MLRYLSVNQLWFIDFIAWCWLCHVIVYYNTHYTKNTSVKLGIFREIVNILSFSLNICFIETVLLSTLTYAWAEK